MRLSGSLMATVAVAVLLAALSFLMWRQARALEALAGLDGLRREISLVTSERNELVNRIQVLEGRGRIVPAARDRLGMQTPNGGEIVWLSSHSEIAAAGAER